MDPSATTTNGTATNGTTSTAAAEPVLVTGHAGFIGFHTAQRLLQRGTPLVGIDAVNDYYDVALKEARLGELQSTAAATGTPYTSLRADLTDQGAVDDAFASHPIGRVIHLAAQAGVRHSLNAPRDYVASNIAGFLNILEGCRAHQTAHLTYASTSSVYGANTRLPFAEGHGADHPLQLYAATKRANELMAHSYSHLFAIPTTGLRFFTVYGPWGRPDMALFLFTQKILAGEPIPVFNHGRHTRDFTFVDDIVEGVIRASDDIAAPDPGFDPAAPAPHISAAPYRVFNIGNGAPATLERYISALETALERPAIRDYRDMQPGDVADTFADTTALKAAVGYAPATPVEQGVAAFVAWYRNYYNV